MVGKVSPAALCYILNLMKINFFFFHVDRVCINTQNAINTAEIRKCITPAKNLLFF